MIYNLIIDDEKFSVNKVFGKRFFDSTDPSAARLNIWFQQKIKFQSKIMVV